MPSLLNSHSDHILLEHLTGNPQAALACKTITLRLSPELILVEKTFFCSLLNISPLVNQPDLVILPITPEVTLNLKNSPKRKAPHVSDHEMELTLETDDIQTLWRNARTLAAPGEEGITRAMDGQIFQLVSPAGVLLTIYQRNKDLC